MRPAFYSVGLLMLCNLFFVRPAEAQSRDYFTPEEIEMIRDAQQIDQRISVLVHAADRRFAALKISVSPSAAPGKVKANWGEINAGSRTDLFSDIKNIIQKAIDDIDNLAERPDSAPIPFDPKEKPQASGDLLATSVRSLAAAAKRYKPALQTEMDASKDPRETGLIADSIELCDEIIESVSKLPAEAPKKNKKDH